jgi:hypothetical protein
MSVMSTCEEGREERRDALSLDRGLVRVEPVGARIEEVEHVREGFHRGACGDALGDIF